MKYLITGGAGFIGSHIAQKLVALGEQVIVFDNFSTGKKENIAHIADKIEVVEGDITDLEALTKATKGVDYIAHHAAQISVPKSIENPQETMAVNGQGTLNVLMAAQKNGVKKITFASSSAVYGDTENLPVTEEEPIKPLSPYAVSKALGEYYCQAYSHLHNLDVTVFRYFNVYGERQDPNSPYAAAIPIFKKLASEGKPLKIFGDGSQTRDFVNVSDVADANIKALCTKTDSFPVNIGTGQAITINDLARLISANVVNEPERPGDIKHSVSDISRAEKILDFKPKTNLEI